MTSTISQSVLPEVRRGGVQGRLGLDFQRSPSLARTTLQVFEQQPPLRAIRAFPLDDGAALVHLHNVSGGVLGGDQLDLRVEAGSAARAQLTTTGATRIYRSRENHCDAVQHIEVTIGENGLLEYLPDAIIPFAGSRYRQETRVFLAPGAGIFWWEIVAPGRQGEVFAYHKLEMKLEIVAAGRPIALEHFCLEPAIRPLDSPARLGPYRYFSSFHICHAGLPAARWIELEDELNDLGRQLSRPSEILWAASTLAADGLVVRAASLHAWDLQSGLMAFWNTARLRICGRTSVMPRKTP